MLQCAKRVQDIVNVRNLVTMFGDFTVECRSSRRSLSTRGGVCDSRKREQGALHSFDRLELAGDERWFLARTQPRGERRAQLHLNAQGFRTYAPWILKTVRHARQFRSIHAPLFPGYLFIILDLGRDRWPCVRSTVGVASLICRDNGPLPVPAGVVESLIAQTDAGNITRLDSGLVKGAPVRILSGPFAEFVGTLERLDEAGRVRVLLKIMGTAVPVVLHRTALALAV
jgi:transcription elongation factor/antiterminator RfaH